MAEEDGSDAGSFGAALDAGVRQIRRGVAEHELAGWQAMAAIPGGPTGLADGFLVDTERAEVAIATLTGVIDDLEAAQIHWYQQHFKAPGIDPVSIRLGENMRVMQQRAVAYVQAWTAQVKATRDALQAQVDGYRRVDQDNAARRA
jgi:hypothetical protein